jgi:hypothetical protein
MTGQIEHEYNLHPRMTERYERRLMERGAAANEKSMRVRTMDGARAGGGGGKMLSSGIMSAAGFADIAVGEHFCLPIPSSQQASLFFYSVQRTSGQRARTNA